MKAITGGGKAGVGSKGPKALTASTNSSL